VRWGEMGGVSWGGGGGGVGWGIRNRTFLPFNSNSPSPRLQSHLCMTDGSGVVASLARRSSPILATLLVCTLVPLALLVVSDGGLRSQAHARSHVALCVGAGGGAMVLGLRMVAAALPARRLVRVRGSCAFVWVTCGPFGRRAVCLVHGCPLLTGMCALACEPVSSPDCIWFAGVRGPGGCGGCGCCSGVAHPVWR
jgi:hypothetical protein